MTASDRPPLERQRYWQGQTLRSGDLRDQLAHDAQRRWWHNRALHNAFGIVEGLTVTGPHESSRTNYDRRFVRVLAGLAYDCHGREVCVPSVSDVPLPSPGDRATEWTLLVRLAGRAGSDFGFPSSDRIGFSKPEFHWVESPRVELTDGVPLARGIISAATDSTRAPRPAARIDQTVRALPPRTVARPRLQCGTTIPGKTHWTIWEEELRRGFRVGGIQTEIDTSAAGFTFTPCYFAWLHSGTLPPLQVLSPFHAEELFSIFCGRISQATATRFVFSLPISVSSRDVIGDIRRATDRFRGISVRNGRATQESASRIRSNADLPQIELHVGWLGVESEGDDCCKRKDDHERHR